MGFRLISPRPSSWHPLPLSSALSLGFSSGMRWRFSSTQSVPFLKFFAEHGVEGIKSRSVRGREMRDERGVCAFRGGRLCLFLRLFFTARQKQKKKGNVRSSPRPRDPQRKKYLRLFPYEPHSRRPKDPAPKAILLEKVKRYNRLCARLHLLTT